MIGGPRVREEVATLHHDVLGVAIRAPNKPDTGAEVQNTPNSRSNG